MAANKAVASAPHTRPLFPQSCRPPGLIPSCRSGPCPVTQTSAPRQVHCSAQPRAGASPVGRRPPGLHASMEPWRHLTGGLGGQQETDTMPGHPGVWPGLAGPCPRNLRSQPSRAVHHLGGTVGVAPQHRQAAQAAQAAQHAQHRRRPAGRTVQWRLPWRTMTYDLPESPRHPVTPSPSSPPSPCPPPLRPSVPQERTPVPGYLARGVYGVRIQAHEALPPAAANGRPPRLASSGGLAPPFQPPPICAKYLSVPLYGPGTCNACCPDGAVTQAHPPERLKDGAQSHPSQTQAQEGTGERKKKRRKIVSGTCRRRGPPLLQRCTRTRTRARPSRTCHGGALPCCCPLTHPAVPPVAFIILAIPSSPFY